MSDALALFEKARANDDLVSHRESKSMFKDFTLEDWQSVAQKYSSDNQLNGVKGGVIVQELPNEFQIINNELDVRSNDTLKGVSGFLIGLATTGAGWGAGAFAANRGMMGGDWRVKLGATAVGAAIGYWNYHRMTGEVEDLKTNGTTLHIPKSGLASVTQTGSLMHFPRAADLKLNA